MSRSEINFQVCEIGSRISLTTTASIKSVNINIQFVLSTPGFILFPQLDTKSTTINFFADANYNNLSSGSRSGEQIFLVKEKYNKS